MHELALYFSIIEQRQRRLPDGPDRRNAYLLFLASAGAEIFVGRRFTFWKF